MIVFSESTYIKTLMNSTTDEKRKAQKPPTNENLTDEDKSGNNPNPNTAPYLPTPIINEILLRAEIRTLSNCLRVCKSWAKFISTREFAQLHLVRSRTKCLISSPYATISERKPIRLNWVDLEEINTYSPQNNIIKTRVDLPEPNVLTYRVTSCNGLVCFIASYPKHPINHLCMRERFLGFSPAIYVCNPVHRDYIIIPKPSHADELYEQYFAFGYSIRTYQYKVIVCSRDIRSFSWETDIYTLGAGSWRKIVNAPYPLWSGDYSFNTSVNGAFHWILPQQGSSDPFICSFDFDTEEFHSVPEPSEFGPLEKQRRYKMRVGVINGNLSLSDCSKNDHIAIWVMKDYGVKESWIKHIVINRICGMRQLGVYELIMTMSDGKILLKSEYESIRIYNPKSHLLESELDFPGISRSSFSVVAHVPSLISLKDVAKHENLKVRGGN